jgi:hypothetical protein
VLLAAAPALANEFALGIKTAANLDGLLGRQNIRTDPATVTGIAFVHPTQVDAGVADGDFVGIGTYKGIGATGANSCANDYDALWSIYRDQELNGVYSCYTIATDVYAAGANPSFQIQLTACSGSTRWALYFDGILRACVTAPLPYASGVAVGIETAGTSTDYNIDVKYLNLYKHFVGSGTWFAFGDCDFAPSFADPNYDVDGPSTIACNTFLPPLN